MRRYQGDLSQRDLEGTVLPGQTQQMEQQQEHTSSLINGLSGFLLLSNGAQAS